MGFIEVELVLADLVGSGKKGSGRNRREIKEKSKRKRAVLRSDMRDSTSRLKVCGFSNIGRQSKKRIPRLGKSAVNTSQRAAFKTEQAFKEQEKLPGYCVNEFRRIETL